MNVCPINAEKSALRCKADFSYSTELIPQFITEDYFPSKSLCVPVRVSVSTKISSSYR